MMLASCYSEEEEEDEEGGICRRKQTINQDEAV